MPPATRAAIFKKLAKKAVQEQAYNRRFETGSEDGLRTSTVYSRVRDQSLDSLENSLEIRKESHLRTKSSVMEYMNQNQHSKSKAKTEFNKDLQNHYDHDPFKGKQVKALRKPADNHLEGVEGDISMETDTKL